MNRFAKYLTCICVLLLPATAYANGLHALAQAFVIIVVGAAVTFFFALVLLVASAVIGRKNAPRRRWKRAYGWTALVTSSLCELYLLPLAIMVLVAFSGATRGGGWLIMSTLALAAVVGGVSIALAVRVVRRNS